MPQRCSSCDSTGPDGAKFCAECGTRFARAAQASTAAQPVSERRTTTVLFGDLVSFTTLSEARDPEDVRELLSAYFAVARTVVGRYGGTVEKFVGDAVMAVWGVPVSHEDDAERAVRAGLDLVGEAAALGARVGVPDLAMRVGIVTGTVAVTLGAVGEGMVAGDAVNTAARVQAVAAPGTVWVDHETRGLAVAAVAFTDQGEHALRGKAEAVRLHRADAVVAAVGGLQRVDGLEAPLTGRDAELRRVKELFHATEADGRSRLVVVQGQAGLGKSRLGWEFEKYADGLADPVRWHRGRCLSYGEGIAFWALAEMVRSRLGLLEDDERSVVEVGLRAGVDAVAATPAEADRLVARLAGLLGVGDGAVFERTDLFAAWSTYLDRVAGDVPIVLLLEDAQHADAGLVDLLEHLLESSRARLFVLVLARPELLEERPSLAALRRATVIDLEPLPDGAMETLVDGLVAELPRRARSAIVARAEGVPLYAVETVRSLVDRDAVQAREGRHEFVDHDHALVDLAQLAAPTSLQTLIAARLDTLEPAERRTVQDASVLGLAFRRSALASLTELDPERLDRTLAALVRKAVLTTEDDPRSPERGQYVFVQSLVREVAYSTLARRDRRTRHLAAAAHLEADESDDALVGIIAQHLLDAYAVTPATDPDRSALGARTRARLSAASVRSESLGSPQEALRAALAALGLDPGEEERAALGLRVADVAVVAGEHVLAEETAAGLVAWYAGTGDLVRAAEAAAIRADALITLGRLTEAAEGSRTALGWLPEGTHPSLRFRLVAGLGTSIRWTDREEYWRTGFTQMRLAEELQQPERLVDALSKLAIMTVDTGGITAYMTLMERCVELSREGHLLRRLGRSLANLASEVYPRDLARSRELAVESIDVCRQVGDADHIEVALINAACAWWLAGDWDLLVGELDEWLEGRPPTSCEAMLLVLLDQVRGARGEPPLPRGDQPDSEDPYEQHAKELHGALHRELGGDLAGAAAAAAASAQVTFADLDADVLDDFEVLWAPVVELLLRAGDLDGAGAAVDLAAPLLGGRSRALTLAEHARLRGTLAAARGEDAEADLRAAERAHAAYGAPYLLARTRLELGRWLVGRGRRAEAEPLLAQARETFEALRATPSVDEVDALRATVVPLP